MNEIQREELIQSLPFEDRPEIREFLQMDPEHRGVHTHQIAISTERSMTERLDKLDEGMGEVLLAIADLKRPVWKQVVLGPFAIAGAFVGGLFGSGISRPGG